AGLFIADSERVDVEFDSASFTGVRAGVFIDSVADSAVDISGDVDLSAEVRNEAGDVVSGGDARLQIVGNSGSTITLGASADVKSAEVTERNDVTIDGFGAADVTIGSDRNEDVNETTNIYMGNLSVTGYGLEGALFKINPGATVNPDSPQADGVSTVAIIGGVLSSGEALEVTLTDGDDAAAILTAVQTAINDATDSLFEATLDEGTIILTGVDSSVDADVVTLSIEDRDANGEAVKTYAAEDFGSEINEIPVEATFNVHAWDSMVLDTGTVDLTSKGDAELVFTNLDGSDSIDVALGDVTVTAGDAATVDVQHGGESPSGSVTLGDVEVTAGETADVELVNILGTTEVDVTAGVATVHLSDLDSLDTVLVSGADAIVTLTGDMGGDDANNGTFRLDLGNMDGTFGAETTLGDFGQNNVDTGTFVETWDADFEGTVLVEVGSGDLVYNAEVVAGNTEQSKNDLEGAWTTRGWVSMNGLDSSPLVATQSISGMSYPDYPEDQPEDTTASVFNRVQFEQNGTSFRIDLVSTSTDPVGGDEQNEEAQITNEQPGVGESTEQPNEETQIANDPSGGDETDTQTQSEVYWSNATGSWDALANKKAFTDALGIDDVTFTASQTHKFASYTIRADVTVAPEGEADKSVAFIGGILDQELLEVDLDTGDVGAEILDDIAAAINSAEGAMFTAAVTGNTIELSASSANANADDVVFLVDDLNGTELVARFTSQDLGSAITTRPEVEIELVGPADGSSFDVVEDAKQVLQTGVPVKALSLSSSAGELAADGIGQSEREVFTFTGDDIGEVILGGFNANGFDTAFGRDTDRLDFSQFAAVDGFEDLTFGIDDDDGYFADVIIDFVDQDLGSIRLVGVGELENAISHVQDSILFVG
uniref:hypothetical protein n=1 Tax=Marivita sp. TaxID=2003365 RepID=UPI0025C510AF